MPGGGKSCNGVMKTGELSTDGLITYRRKKRARAVGHEFVRESLDGADEHDVFPRVGIHWRNTLEDMLHLPGVGEGGGIQSCIQNALESCAPSFTRKSEIEVPVAILQSEDRSNGNCEIEDPLEVKDVIPEFAAEGSNMKLDSQTDVDKNTAKCQKVLLDIFRSKNFASLCDLVCESFQSKTVRKLLDFSLINSKLKNGMYEQVPVSFHEDIQQLWCKFQKIGQDMLLLSSSLSKQSRFSYRKQVGEKLELEAGEEKFEANNDNPQAVAELKNSMNSYVNGQFPLSESGWSNKLDQSEASCLCKFNACKQCGIETVGEHRLICDGCEAIYHFSCVEPSSQAVPSRSWYCPSCHKDESKSPRPVWDNQLIGSHKKWAICDRRLDGFMVGKNIVNNFNECHCSNKPCQSEASCRYKVYTCKQCSAEAIGEHSLICDGCEEIYHFSCVEPFVEAIPTRNWYCASCRAAPEPVIEIEQDGLHQNCAVCDRLDFSEAVKDITNDTRESSISSMESDSPPEPSRTAMAHLCKICGTCEDEDRRFLTCGNNYCPYKYYHIRCLRNSQIASQHQQNSSCWYCPSCLCRACYLDQDDAEIVLCDGCDNAYHTYCMKPPRTSVPKGQWYCVQCNMLRVKEGIRRHEEWIMQQHCKKDVFQTVGNNRSLDILLNAVEKVSSEN